MGHRICKDVSKKFCPSCGNPTLLRASVTISSGSGSPGTSTMHVHLKKNFQYKIRGTIYSIPSPKPGSAKKGTGEGLILREDQIEYVRAKKRNDGKREREEQKMMKNIFTKNGDGAVSTGSWMDPDWMPGVMSASVGKREMNPTVDGSMPVIGYGRRNPNERKRRK
jgi:RNA-binding protein NOB1